MSIIEFIPLLLIFLFGVIAAVVCLAVVVALLVMTGHSIGNGLSAASRRHKIRAEAFATQIGATYKKGRYLIPGGLTESGLPDSSIISLKSKTTGGDEPDIFTEIEWRVPLPCPNLELAREGGFYFSSEIKIGVPMFDAIFRIYGKKEPTRTLLQPELQEAIVNVYTPTATHSRAFSLKIKNRGRRDTNPSPPDPAKVILQIPGDTLPRMLLFESRAGKPSVALLLIKNAQGLQAALEDRLWQPWTQAATDHGLTLDKENVTLTGTIDGHPVSLTLGNNRTHAFVIHIPVRGPRGLHIIHKDKTPDTGDAVATNNPLVGRMLSVIGEDNANINALFHDQEWIDNLLPLIHGYKGSEVTEDGITVRITERLTEFSPLIQNAVVVAKGLAKQQSRLPKEEIGASALEGQLESATVKE